MKRYFSKREKVAVAIATGRSEKLDGDHLVPFSKGGATDVANLQLIRSETNRLKSDNHIQLREWQKEFTRKWDKRKSGEPFMLVVIPGGGKTFGSLCVARNWLEAGSDRRLMVVVPTDSLRNQWAQEATQFGIDLQSKEFGTSFKDDYQGGVVTYALASINPLVMRKLCSSHPTMVIFDEIHHCGDEKSYGRGVQDGFELAKEKLLMSGTPWQTDGTPIPFVSYDGSGYVNSDYSYDYPRALQDDVVRYLVFRHEKGVIAYSDGSDDEPVNAKITIDEASKRLGKLLSPDGSFVRMLIGKANEALDALRLTIPDAGGLIICKDTYHAQKVAQVLTDISGEAPAIIVSDASTANSTIDDFKHGKSKWIVAVRMVSEGVDIKRLQVLCYLTNVLTEMFFRQAIGRVSRVRGMDDFEGLVFLPEDPRLVKLTQNIENAQILALKSKEQSEFDFSERQPGEFTPDDRHFDTDSDGAGAVFIGNRKYTSEEHEYIESLANQAKTSLAVTAKLMELLATQAPKPIHSIESKKPVKTKEDVERSIRQSCSQTAYALSKRIGCEVRDIHNRFKPQKNMTQAELNEKLETLRKELRATS